MLVPVIMDVTDKQQVETAVRTVDSALKQRGTRWFCLLWAVRRLLLCYQTVLVTACVN